MGSGHILGTSRLPKETWMANAECFVLMLPLRECAGRRHVCLKTAYTMRHRLIECLSAYSPSFKTGRGCGCELDEIYFPESFKDKGNRAKGLFAMPSNIPATTIRIDPEAKKEATAILDELGLPMSTAVNAFLRALVREGGMLFEMKVKAPAIDLKR